MIHLSMGFSADSDMPLVWLGYLIEMVMDDFRNEFAINKTRALVWGQKRY